MYTGVRNGSNTRKGKNARKTYRIISYFYPTCRTARKFELDYYRGSHLFNFSRGKSKQEIAILDIYGHACLQNAQKKKNNPITRDFK
jgi:hypothetical protein